MIPCVELGDRSPEQRKRPVCPPYSRMSGKQRTSERTASEEDHEKRRIVSADPISQYTISVLFVK